MDELFIYDIHSAFDDSSDNSQKFTHNVVKNLNNLPFRVSLEGNQLLMDNTDEDIKKVYITLLAAVLTPWFHSLVDGTRKNYSDVLKHFFKWLSTKSITPSS